jgi:hypothetical protein
MAEPLTDFLELCLVDNLGGDFAILVVPCTRG